MKDSLLPCLRCPECAGPFAIAGAKRADGEIESGDLVCRGCSRRFPILRGIPRFVPQENYAGNFGFQWNRFRTTQLDSHSGRTISRERFLTATGWTPDWLAGKNVLDVGCGAGRFAEAALACGATVFAVDFSSAADACRANFPGHPRLHVVQADAFALPFPAGFFDAVYCLGVLQHTPDPKGAFLALPRLLKPGGRLAVDVYQGGWRRVAYLKYWLRFLTTRLPQDRLFRAIERSMPALLRVSRAVGRVPTIGPIARRVLPIANYEGIFNLDERQLYEWAVLDTFDMLAPTYDRPQTASTLRRWALQAQLEEIEVGKLGHLVARGRKPLADAAAERSPAGDQFHKAVMPQSLAS